MYNISDNTRSLAAELAEKIISGDQPGTWLPYLQPADAGGGFVTDPDRLFAASPQALAGKIGIWVADTVEGQPCYVRDSAKVADWRLWSNRHLIPATDTRKRIVLLGESVARGYFYDPFYCPAMELQQQLNTALPQAEVIDLAKSGMVLEELEVMFRSCMQLQPAAVVIFAGNNWTYALKEIAYGAAHIEEMTQALLQHDYNAARHFLENQLQDVIAAFMKRIAATAEQYKVPIIFVIPEFNLADWKSTDKETTASRLAEDLTNRFLETAAAARQMKAAGNWTALQPLAAALIQLDGVNPLGYELMAACMLAGNQPADARKYLEQARDTVVFNRVENHSPRCLTVTRKAILRAAAAYRFTVVDLPEVFKALSPNGIPGREFFLDYCHLTDTGIKAAMQATAAALAPLLGATTGVTAADNTAAPDPEHRALAYLFAASLNARFGQPEDILLHHCRKGVAISDAAAKFISLYASLSNRRLSTPLCKSYEQITLEKMAEQYNKGTGLLHGVARKQMDHVLVDCMVNALKEKGMDLSEQVSRLRAKEHSVRQGSVNLLDSFYNLFNSYVLTGEQDTHYTASRPQSSFILMADNTAPVQVKITFRVKNKPHGTVRLWVNGSMVMEAAATENWQTHMPEVPATVLKNGLNDLQLEWPAVVPAGDSVFSETPLRPFASMQALRHSLRLYPVFGEIHTFTVSA
ncbi:hypothetical protein SAMN04488505_11520 [Chitinophaga rupis]|uniref:Uncharacterized protein n=1 Tax=Chitinophaga rupis TaxID=573321 RepID=A0A1H8KF72_9BACT|nr:SGNH/GDSL hydrolase family protein [Chitinophaga rupis]SEN91417.1 hypothetical protein SAMN04488505_11520 [Chitinophaga rupis]